MPIADIDYHEYLDEAKINEIRTTFLEYGPDGVIGEAELAEMFKNLGHTMTRRQLMEIIHEVDFDGSGSIELEEFYVMNIKLNKLWPRPDIIDYRDYLQDVKIRHIRRAFEQLDTTESGFIDVEEMDAVLESLKVVYQVKDGVYDAVMKQAAPDGRLCFDRCCAAAVVLSHARKRINYREFLSFKEVDYYRKVFHENDGNSDGAVTKDELERCLQRLGFVLKKGQLQRLFEDFDVDESGNIDFEEFCVMMCRMCRKRRLRKIDPQTCTCRDLYREDHFTVKELLLAGFKLKDLREANVPARDIYNQGISALEFRRAGYTPTELRRAGVNLTELRGCGYSLTDLRLAGFSDGSVAEANRNFRSCISKGNLGLLAQCNPSSQRVVYPKDTLKSLPLTHPLRLMTPMIRDHTDWNVFPPAPRTFQEKAQFLAAGASVVGTGAPSITESVPENDVSNDDNNNLVP